jgi:hypothetical protein
MLCADDGGDWLALSLGGSSWPQKNKVPRRRGIQTLRLGKSLYSLVGQCHRFELLNAPITLKACGVGLMNSSRATA